MAIQMRRGADNKFDPAKMLPAEIAVTVDGTRKVYAAFGPGDVKELASKEEVQNIVNNFTGTVDKKIAEAVKQVTDEAQEQIDNIAAKGQEVLDSIPADYQDAVAQVEKNTLAIFDLDRFKASAIIQKAKGRSIVIKDSAKAGIPGMRTLGKSEQRKLTGKNLVESYFVNGKNVGIIALPLTANTTYTVSFTGEQASAIYARQGMLAEGGDASSGTSIGYVYNSNKFTFTPAESGEYHIQLYYANNAPDISAITNVQLEVGAEVTIYEPYCGGSPVPNPQYPQAIVNAGQKMVDGWQLLDISNVEDHSTTSKEMHVNLLAGTYTFSCSNNESKRLRILYEDGTYIDPIPWTTLTVCTFTAEKPIVGVQVNSNTAIDLVAWHCQLNVGTEAKPWEPYTCGGFTDGSQLLKITAVNKLSNGVEFTVNNSSVRRKGTATIDFEYELSEISLSAGTYCSNVIVYRLTSEGTWVETIQPNTAFVVTDTSQKFRPLIWQVNGVFYDDTVLPMLNRGSVAKAWQPYTAGMKPVIDVPIETEVLGKNLAVFTIEGHSDLSKFTYESNTAEYIKATKKVDNGQFFARFEVNVKKGETYCVSAKENIMTFVYEDELWGSRVIHGNLPITFTAPKDGTYVVGPFVDDNAGTTFTLTNFQIEVGTEATPYQPCTKQTLTINKPGGFPGIEVTDASLANYTDENGQMWVCDERDWDREIYVGNLLEVNHAAFTPSVYDYYELEVKKNPFVNGAGTYVFSAEGDFGYPYSLWTYDANGNIIHNFSVGTHNVTAEEAAKVASYRFVFTHLTIGTAYDGYVYPMLRPVEIDGIPTSAKYVPYTDGKFVKMRGADVKRIGREVFDGSADEPWAIGALTVASRFAIRLSDAMPQSSVLCSQGITSTKDGSACAVAPSKNFYIDTDNTVFTSAELWKNHLMSMPMTVDYILATPILTHITEEEASAQMALHTNYPATTILSNADHEVEYVTDTKTYIDNKFAELAAAYVAGSEV